MWCKCISQQFSEMGESGTSPLCLHSNCWYLAAKGHCEERHAAQQDKGVGNSWMVSLQIQTFRNSLTQRKSWLSVHFEVPKAELPDWCKVSVILPQPVLSTPGTICCQRLSCQCQDGVGGAQLSTAPFPCPRAVQPTQTLPQLSLRSTAQQPLWQHLLKRNANFFLNSELSITQGFIVYRSAVNKDYMLQIWHNFSTMSATEKGVLLVIYWLNKYKHHKY